VAGTVDAGNSGISTPVRTRQSTCRSDKPASTSSDRATTPCAREAIDATTWATVLDCPHIV
jgi:hypothetical protein